MEIYQLRQFLAVVEMRSFTRAALRIGVSQPALSTGISKLEEALGVLLFTRDRRSVALTAQGHRFAVRARQILDACSQAKSEARLNDTGAQARIAILSSLPTQKITALAKACVRAFPEINFDFREAISSDGFELLEKGKVDFAIAAASTENDDDFQKSLFEESYMLACAVDHPFSQRSAIRLNDIHDEKFVLRTSCEARRATQDILSSQSIRPRLVARTSQDDRALELVAAGIGVALMPALFAAPGVIRVPISDYQMNRRIVVRRRPDSDEKIFQFLARTNLEHL